VLLVCHAYGLRHSELYTAADLPPEVVGPLVERRASREPVQHIVGCASFRRISVAVGPGVFVPRPETELLVDAVLPVLSAAAAPVAVDLCAGSGALALALADEVPGIAVHAVERAPAALAWLRRNCAGTPVIPVAGDVADAALRARLPSAVDAVVSNPPYVPGETPVAPEVRADPRDAVFAGADGLALMPAVLARAGELLRPGGVLALEHDESHGHTLRALLIDAGSWSAVTEHRDLAGRPRYVTAERRAG
jgi:release factor glutamine methyltransferase